MNRNTEEYFLSRPVSGRRLQIPSQYGDHLLSFGFLVAVDRVRGDVRLGLWGAVAFG